MTDISEVKLQKKPQINYIPQDNELDQSYSIVDNQIQEYAKPNVKELDHHQGNESQLNKDNAAIPFPPSNLKLNNDLIIRADLYLLKDQDLIVKKNQTIKALILLFFMETVKFALTTYIWFEYGSQLALLSIFIFPLAIMLWFFVSIINLKIKYQTRAQTYVLSMLLILLQSLTLFSFTRLFKSEYLRKGREHLLFETNEIAKNLIYSLALNCFYILLITLYLCWERRNIKVLFAYLCFGVSSFIITALQSNISCAFLISFFYGISLIHTIKNIWEGKFNIFLGKIIQMANAMQVGIFFPFNF